MNEPQRFDSGSTSGWDPWSVMGAVARDPHRAPPGGSIPAQGGGGGVELAPSDQPAALSPFENDVVGLLLSGYLDTEIRARAGSDAGEHYRWTFGPGVERRQDLRWVPLELRAPLDLLSDSLAASGAGRLSQGWVDGDRRHHYAPGRMTLSALLNSAHPSRARIVAAGRTVGASLRGLRGIDISHLDLAPPAGPARLKRWLTTGDGPFAAAVMHEFLTTKLGPARIDEVISWTDGLQCDHLAVGRSGLETAVVSETAEPSALLIGDEICAAPRDFDLSWTLGGLFILELEAGALPHDLATERRDAITACRDALLVSYGPSDDLITTGRMTALRVLLQLHDAAAFDDRQLETLASEVASLVDDAR